MSVSTAKKLETRENFFVPVIVNTAPVKRKELDLTFVRMVQRKRNALDYIAKVEARNKKKSSAKEIIGNIAGTLGLFGMIYGLYMIGMFF